MKNIFKKTLKFIPHLSLIFRSFVAGMKDLGKILSARFDALLKGAGFISSRLIYLIFGIFLAIGATYVYAAWNDAKTNDSGQLSQSNWNTFVNEIHNKCGSNCDTEATGATASSDTLTEANWNNLVDLASNTLTDCTDNNGGKCFINQTSKSALDTDLAAGNIKSGVTIFGLAGIYTGIKTLPDTGQTSSYTATYGEDNDYTSANSPSTCNPSFTDNGNGTITDNCTGLMWKKCTEPDTSTTNCAGYVNNVNWENALSQCQNLIFGGYNNWRLPNVKELMSIVNYQNSLPAINTTYFPNTNPGSNTYYWSSTTVVHNTTSAWGVSFGYGLVDYTGKIYNLYVRCVRG
ncbi:MAG: DUF1566 domain-containing protein [Patescibacteria group bacterium]|nr:DUF1566 domain-containing protein [Patescibacteria group bacterium]